MSTITTTREPELGESDRCWRCGDERGPHVWTHRGVQCANPEQCDDRYDAKREAKRKESK